MCKTKSILWTSPNCPEKFNRSVARLKSDPRELSFRRRILLCRFLFSSNTRVRGSPCSKKSRSPGWIEFVTISVLGWTLKTTTLNIHFLLRLHNRCNWKIPICQFHSVLFLWPLLRRFDHQRRRRRHRHLHLHISANNCHAHYSSFRYVERCFGCEIDAA